MTGRWRPLALAALGLGLGFTLSRAGFTDWEEVNRMLRLADRRLVLAFGGAIALASAGFLALARRDGLPARPFRRSTIPGGLLFGAGWAIAGACPAAALAQVGEGRLPAAATLAGLLGGSWLHAVLSRRMGWRGDSCSGAAGPEFRREGARP